MKKEGLSVAKGAVLVVDDNQGIRFLLEKALKCGGGYRVLTAGNVRDAISILRAHRVDLVILDILLPDINGLQFLKKLKSDNPFLPIIIMTAYDRKRNIIEAVRQHADYWFTKPFETKEVLYVAESLICKKASLIPLNLSREKNAGSNETLIEKVLKLLQSNSTLSLNEVAESMGTTHRYISKVFVSSGEGTFFERKRQIMVEEAKNLLCKEEISIRELSHRMGFRSIPYFRRVFKKLVGFTPHLYRIQK